MLHARACVRSGYAPIKFKASCLRAVKITVGIGRRDPMSWRSMPYRICVLAAAIALLVSVGARVPSHGWQSPSYTWEDLHQSSDGRALLSSDPVTGSAVTEAKEVTLSLPRPDETGKSVPLVPLQHVTKGRSTIFSSNLFTCFERYASLAW